mmetsp:Transcript_21501/g.49635  ORF Transcript_21501/g.49635 Transcript_21501/m.49635 type:complete len:203 (-) Transcript_21501:1603-2211(-)
MCPRCPAAAACLIRSSWTDDSSASPCCPPAAAGVSAIATPSADCCCCCCWDWSKADTVPADAPATDKSLAAAASCACASNRALRSGAFPVNMGLEAPGSALPANSWWRCNTPGAGVPSRTSSPSAVRSPARSLVAGLPPPNSDKPAASIAEVILGVVPAVESKAEGPNAEAVSPACSSNAGAGAPREIDRVRWSNLTCSNLT